MGENVALGGGSLVGSFVDSVGLLVGRLDCRLKLEAIALHCGS